MLRIFAFSLFLFTAAFAQTHQHGAMPAAPAVDGQYNPFVVANPRGGFYLVYVQRTGASCDVMLRSSSDGQNFSAPVRVNDRAGDGAVRNENPPKLVVANNGDVYVCWSSERERWKGDIRFARSTDGGKTFAPAMTLNSDAGGAPTGHAFQSIAVDSKGKIFVAWIDERNKTKANRGGEIWLSVSTNRGKSFAHDYRILSDVCECCRTTLQLDTRGNIFLSYRTVPASGVMNRDIIVAKSSDQGLTFTPTIVSQDGWEINGCPVAGPSLSLDSSGNPSVVWFMGGGSRPGLYFVASNDQGKTFSARQLVDPNQKIGKHAHLVGFGNGKAFVTWDDADAKTFSVWGIIDLQNGLQQKSSEQAGIAYPVAAVNGKIAVIVGMKMATHEVVTFIENLN